MRDQIDYSGEITFVSEKVIPDWLIEDLEIKIRDQVAKFVSTFGILSPIHNVKVSIEKGVV